MRRIASRAATVATAAVGMAWPRRQPPMPTCDPMPVRRTDTMELSQSHQRGGQRRASVAPGKTCEVCPRETCDVVRVRRRRWRAAGGAGDVRPGYAAGLARARRVGHAPGRA